MSMRRLASETAVYGLSSILGRGLYFLLTPLYTSYFSPFENGIQTNAFALLGVLMVAAVLRLDMAYFRFAKEEEESRLLGTATLGVALSAGIMALSLVLFSEVLADALGYTAYRAVFIMAAGILFFDALVELPLARLRMQGRAWRFAGIRLAGIVLNLGLNLFWLWWIPNYWPEAPAWVRTPLAGISYIFLANLMSSALVFALCTPEWKASSWQFDKVLFGKMWRFAAPLIIVGFSFIINELLDRQILPLVWPGGKTEGLELLGIYGQNYKLAMLLALFTQAFRYGAEPFIFQQRGMVNAEHKYARLTEMYMMAALLGAVAVSLFLPALSQLFLRAPAYRSGSDVVLILLLANLSLGLYYNLSVWYKVTDNTRYGAWISVGGAVITVLLNLLLIPKYGFYGCAWATVACYGSMCLATWGFGRKRYPVPYRWGFMGAISLLALITAALGWWLSTALMLAPMDLALNGTETSGWLRYASLNGALLMGYSAALWMIWKRMPAEQISA